LVVDTSVLLAVIFNEPHGSWAANRLHEYRGALRISTVNYAETLILVRRRQPQLYAQIREAIEASSIRLAAPDAIHAARAADAKEQFPLNLGDCFAYALAKLESCPILTLDRDFLKTDLDVVIPRRPV